MKVRGQNISLLGNLEIKISWEVVEELTMVVVDEDCMRFRSALSSKNF